VPPHYAVATSSASFLRALEHARLHSDLGDPDDLRDLFDRFIELAGVSQAVFGKARAARGASWQRCVERMGKQRE
jgi:hypothetical protein